MANETSDPQNIPDYLNIQDFMWKDLSESTRQTLIHDINDSVVATVYLRFQDLFNGYIKVRNTVKDIQKTLGMTNPNGVAPFTEDLKDSIDPMNEAIWRILDNHVEELKSDKQETLKRLLDGKREIIETILDEIENEQ